MNKPTTIATIVVGEYDGEVVGQPYPLSKLAHSIHERGRCPRRRAGPAPIVFVPSVDAGI